MGRIRADDLINLFERMRGEHWAYEWGAAREGCVDCSGAFVYAYKALGGPTIAHGSNTIARKHCGALVPASEAKPGYAMFRWREDGEPERYEKDGMDDFYHIGLKGRNGKVLNAKSTAAGFVESLDSGWKYAAPLLAVAYDEEKEEEKPMYGNATVRTQSGRLNIREGASTLSKILARGGNGARLTVLRDTGAGWLFVRTETGEAGYASAEFVEMDEDAPGEEETEHVDDAKVTIVDSDGNCFIPVGDFRVLVGSVD